MWNRNNSQQPPAGQPQLSAIEQSAIGVERILAAIGRARCQRNG